jgi:hypothetical protein
LELFTDFIVGRRLRAQRQLLHLGRLPEPGALAGLAAGALMLFAVRRSREVKEVRPYN